MAFALHRPESAHAAIELARSLGPEASYLAGGTDLLIQMNRGRRTSSHVIALDRIAELAGVDVGTEGVAIGALTTMKTIERDPSFTGPLGALPEAARVVGGHQIRNVATIGGNIANASPAADLLPALLALDAVVELGGAEGLRTVPLGRFLRGPGVTEREPGELLLRVTIARPPANAATAFIKFGRRRAMEISIVCVAALLEVDDDGGCRDARSPSVPLDLPRCAQPRPKNSCMGAKRRRRPLAWRERSRQPIAHRSAMSAPPPNIAADLSPRWYRAPCSGACIRSGRGRHEQNAASIAGQRRSARRPC
jgi:carbon-monoxide dehydrogenase medium subunit